MLDLMGGYKSSATGFVVEFEQESEVTANTSGTNHPEASSAATATATATPDDHGVLQWLGGLCRQ
jgi:hypothetical protein